MQETRFPFETSLRGESMPGVGASKQGPQRDRTSHSSTMLEEQARWRGKVATVATAPMATSINIVLSASSIHDNSINNGGGG
ncbi:hypothetical protein GOP47_0023941 [Adiantum capillus-veneris]|uniref:Uncharacterized protein n=1 Tax=Adiantum capillus-veneris TaxID=13818 RepID=A0A9D4Z6E8_ADICA|nr:hypothetical protein GOP47_0023941 [Adiantum capillus-veneris]